MIIPTIKNVLEEIEDLIGEYWGTDPIYYTNSKNKEEAEKALDKQRETLNGGKIND